VRNALKRTKSIEELGSESVESTSLAGPIFLTSTVVFRSVLVYSAGVIEFRGAPSISMGRTCHEVRDEMCRAWNR